MTIKLWKCKSCGKEYNVKLSYLHNLHTKKNSNNLQSILKCKQCGKPLDDGEEQIYCKCTTCGNTISGNLDYFVSLKTNLKLEKTLTDNNVTFPYNNKTDSFNIDLIRNIKNTLIVIALLFFIVSVIFSYKAYNVKNDYYNTEYSILNKNAYVGGDAYNYIINGTYFIGYAVIASSAFISGVILCSRTINLIVKIKEYE